MKLFAELINRVENIGPKERLHALRDYFGSVSAAEAAWAMYLLSGRRLHSVVKLNQLRKWAQEYANISDWLFNECYDKVGDLSETIALLVPSRATHGIAPTGVARQGIGHSSVATPQGTDHSSVATPQGTGHSSVATPQGIDNSTVATPQGIDNSTVATPQGIDNSSVAMPQGIDRTSAAAPCAAAPCSVGQSLDLWILDCLKSSESQSENEIKDFVVTSWGQLSDVERVVFNKIISGTFRSSVNVNLVIDSISELLQQDKRIIAHRLLADWQPSAEFLASLNSPATQSEEITKPYIFHCMQPISNDDIADMEDANTWFIEWNWVGVRAQIIKRKGTVTIWSYEDALITSRFPELIKEAAALEDGTVIDGEILAWKDADVLPQQLLLQRMGRKNITARLQEDIPVVFMASDLLEEHGRDLTHYPVEQRKQRLKDLLSNRSKIGSDSEYQQLQLFAPCRLQLSSLLRTTPIIEASTWTEIMELRSTARTLKAEGIILKKKGSAYSSTDEQSWRLWKSDPFKVHAVLVAAQVDEENRNYKFVDYTFAIWKDRELVPFVRTNPRLTNSSQKNMLTDEEISKIDSFVRKNILARFGPVFTVKPELVFELSFEGIQISQRNKSGIAVREPRIIQWKSEKLPDQADSIQSIDQLLNQATVADK